MIKRHKNNVEIDNPEDDDLENLIGQETQQIADGGAGGGQIADDDADALGMQIRQAGGFEDDDAAALD
jgi:hypothetical protein